MLCGVFRTKASKVIAAILGVMILVVITMLVFLYRTEGKQNVEQAVMAENYLKAGNYTQSVEAYLKALSMKGSDQERLTIGLADAYIGLYEYDNALEILRSCYLKTSGNNIKIKIEEVIAQKTDYEYLQSISRADIYFTNLEYDKAIAEYEKAKQIKSKEVVSYQKIAEAYLEKGEFDLARNEVLEGQAITQSSELEKTLEKVDTYILKNQYEGITVQASEYIIQENFDNGIEKYREAITLMPEEPEAYAGLAEVYLSQGKLEEAITLLETAKKYRINKMITDLYEKAMELKGQRDKKEELLAALYRSMEEIDTEKVYDIMNMPLFEELLEAEAPIYYEKEEGDLAAGTCMIIYEDGSIYRGETENGVKKGAGTYFLRTENKQGTGYYYYQGEWSNDIPNGHGKVVEETVQLDETDKSYVSKIVTKGIYYNATENDDMRKTFFINGKETMKIEYSANNGVPLPFTNEKESPIPTPEAESYVIAMIYQGGEPTGMYYSVEPQTLWGVKPFL